MYIYGGRNQNWGTTSESPEDNRNICMRTISHIRRHTSSSCSVYYVSGPMLEKQIQEKLARETKIRETGQRNKDK